MSNSCPGEELNNSSHPVTLYEVCHETHCLFVFLLAGCGQNKNENAFDTSKQDAQLIEKEIADFHSALKKAYNHQGINTDSLMDAYFDPNTYYVTYWGTSEPIDTTKKRLRDALPHVSDYDNQLRVFASKSMATVHTRSSS